jgi:acyl-coenzyme A synthetase/AMP-(fatty) acid ligase
MNYSLPDVLKAAKGLSELRTIVIVDGVGRSNQKGIVHLNEILAKKVESVNFFLNVDVERDMLVLPYSSGTTGVPKGVMLSHKGFGTLLKIASKLVIHNFR